MTSSKVVVITGASRGIGLVMAHYLLRKSHKVVVVARSAEPLEILKNEYPGQVVALAGDLSDFTVADKVVSLALKTFSRIDGLIINHGTLGDVKRISDSTAEEFRSVFDVNFFSAVAFIKSCLPHLRTADGKIILVSSGAATGAYSTWGAYGSSKAAMNHLANTLKAEEPLITSIAIRPGVVDTDMQKSIREQHSIKMDEKDALKFKGLHTDGALLKPELPGHVMAKLVLDAPKELGGKFLSWNDKELHEFQEL